MLVTPPPVKVWAIENNITYIQPENPEEFPQVRHVGNSHMSDFVENLDLFIVVAYGKIIPENILICQSLVP